MKVILLILYNMKNTYLKVLRWNYFKLFMKAIIVCTVIIVRFSKPNL